MTSLKWGLIGTGKIAVAFAHGLEQTDSGAAVAVGSRKKETADAFGDRFGIRKRYGSYEELLADEEVEAVYISTPHPFHARWAVKAAEAGKHVLCEKPLGLNHGEGMAVVEAAGENNVFFMEAFMYRCHPQTVKLVELLKEGTIGEVRMIKASFGFDTGGAADPAGRLFDPDLGGGGILDVGGYPVSLCRLVAGVAAGKQFADPTEVSGSGTLGETGVDEWTAAVLRFENGTVAQVSTGIRAQLENSLEVFGEKGRLSLPNPWVVDRQGPDSGAIILTLKGEQPKTIDIPADRTSYAYEAETVAEAVAAGEKEAAWPAMRWDDTLGNLKTMDAWRQAIGLVYDGETEKGRKPVRGMLRVRDDAPMVYGKIDGLKKKVSRLIMGCDNQHSFAHGAAVWDDWFERGGNAFDTSWVYGAGTMEKLLGKWIKARNVRDDVVVTVKGAHTPRCLPDLMIEDFHVSLERLQLDYADIYIMHRDNPEVPVGEFVDALDELVGKGLIRGVLGGSNWSIERFADVNRYAAKTGKKGFSILNNNLSLARMVHPVWAGCIHVSDQASREWLEKTGTTHFAWSSGARGYFLPENERMKLGEDNFRCWDADDNRARRERAFELADKKRCTPLNIATAYVLNQPFPSFALVGPRTIHETATIMPALNVKLSREEIDWLWGDE